LPFLKTVCYPENKARSGNFDSEVFSSIQQGKVNRPTVTVDIDGGENDRVIYGGGGVY